MQVCPAGLGPATNQGDREWTTVGSPALRSRSRDAPRVPRQTHRRRVCIPRQDAAIRRPQGQNQEEKLVALGIPA